MALRPIAVVLLTGNLVFVAMVATEAGQIYNMINIDYPNAVATSVSGINGINARGDIVGNYVLGAARAAFSQK